MLVRTDMDALPVTEKTGLPYASKVRARDKDGNEVGVMHACGHDMHMTCWVGTARVLAALEGPLARHAGLHRPAGRGDRRRRPHDARRRPLQALSASPTTAWPCTAMPAMQVGHGRLSAKALSLANVDSVDIIVKGKGGHGAAPHTTIDPIVLAARIMLDLQTIVSRERNPLDPAVVTVGSIHGGTKHNIIPDEVKLQLTVRTTKDSTRKHVLEAIERIAKAAAIGMRAPEPVIKHRSDRIHAGAGQRCRPDAADHGHVPAKCSAPDKVNERPPIMGGEDFGRYA